MSFLRFKPILGIGLLTGFFVILLSQSQVATNLENHVFDKFTKWTADPKKWPDEIAVVLIDDGSLEKIGAKYGLRWPWPRSIQASVVAYLKKAGAKVIAYDILFPGESEDAMQDDIFATYLAVAGNVWLVEKPAQDGSAVGLNVSLKDAVKPKIASAAISKDHGGVIRRYPRQGLGKSENISSLSISLAGFPKNLQTREDGILMRWYAKSFELREYQVMPAASIIFPARNALDELKKTKPKDAELDSKRVGELIQSLPALPGMEMFKNKTVFVGCSGVATMDAVATPLSSYETGVMVHATALANLIRDDYLRSVSPWTKRGFILMVSCLVALACTLARIIRWQGILTVLIILGAFGLSFVLFGQNIWLPPLFAVIGGVLSFTAIMTYNYFTEGKQRRELKQMFSDFVSPDVLQELQSDPSGINLLGDRRTGTVLFCDLSGFTTFMESAPPEKSVSAINSYLAEASKILLSRGAYVDKFIGDAVMAIFNIPKPYPDHAVRACLAALELQKMMEDLNQVFYEKYQIDKLSLRTGVNTGEMVAGPMGFARKRNYSALGDAVNLASRLEGANKAYHTKTMIGPETYELVKDHFETRLLDHLRVKGKHQAVRVYELMGVKATLDSKQIQMRAMYNQGMELYQQKHWKEARECFRKALEIIPEDGPSQTYQERCEFYVKNPPGADWDGSFGLDSK